MALMTSIRNNLAKLFGVLAVFFILFIIFDWGMDITGRRGRGRGNAEVLGKVNGQEISYRLFSEMVRRAEENQKKQQNTDLDEETERQIRSQVWNQLVDEILLDQQIERLGITVTDQEIRDIVMGPNPPQFLVKQFTDSTGTFRRDAYVQGMSDPQNREAWIQVEDMIRQEQKRRKLQSLLIATVNVSNDEILQRYIDRNQTMNAEYVLFDVNRLIPDSAVTVTEDDLRKVYDAHPGDFQAKASRRVKYVFFSESPSADDTASVEEEAQRLLKQAQSGAVDFIELAKTYSDIPSSPAFFTHGELSPAKEKAVFSAKKGEIVGPIRDYDGIHLIKILDQRQGKTEYVRASHILLNAVQGPDSVKVIQKARELLKEARSGADFAKLARENSQDYGSAMRGGDLGWSTRDGWVKPFANAAFNAPVGAIVGPVRTQFGWHIIKVTGRDRREVEIADLALKVRASAQTTDAASQQAQDFAYLAKEEGYEKAAENSQFEVHETPDFEKTGSIPGIGTNDELTSFAFTNKLGAISPPISIRGGLAIFKISFVREAGVRPLDEVMATVRQMALREKKMAKLREQVDAFYKTLTPSSDLLADARALPNLTAQQTGPFTPSSSSVAGIGNDPAFIGTAIGLKPGGLSKPVEGIRGFYIIKLLSKAAVDTVKFDSEKSMLREQILHEKQNRFLSDWQASLREKADIVDHREEFYR
jgi:peptidyl-prolyl cis-trans isomerase D